MKAKIINQLGGETHELSPVTVLGRTPQCNVQLSDPRISRRHAMIREQAEGYFYLDLGSANGSYVNGSRVTASHLLQDGDQIGVGDFTFRFVQEGVPAAAPKGADYDATVKEVSSGNVLLFVSDIKGFTALSERLEPDRLAPIIGSWYGQTEAILAEHGGTIDKFIGDCVFAYWTNSEVPNRLRALQCAGAMLQAGHEIQKAHQATLSSINLSFEFGTAMHRGKVAYGRISNQEFTLLGDAVNMAFRLEGLTRQLQHHTLVSGEFLEGWPDGLQFCTGLGPQAVKGREQPMEVYSVHSIPA